MNLPWSPVIIADVVGSSLMLLLSGLCAETAWRLTRNRPDNVFRSYLFLFTLAILLFAISRSFGHLIKHILLLNDMAHAWSHISPFSGAVNTATFIIIFALGISFQRFQKSQGEIEYYKNNLEERVETRTRQLETSKNVLQNILDNTNPINITSVDFDLVKANEAYYTIWPRRSGDGTVLKCYESRPGEHCHTDQCPLELIMSGSEKVTQEVSKTIDDVVRHFIVTARPFRDIDGILVGMVENFQEITLRKKAETALKQMDRIKSEFISTAAHELNTPICSIMGYAELLSDPEKFGGFPEEQKQNFAREIHDNGEALGRIIEDLLDVSRIERNVPLPMNRESTDVTELIRKKVGSYAFQHPEIDFHLDLPDRPAEPKISIDRHRINQVLENLLSNAVKYSTEVREIFVVGHENADSWEVSIRDQGIGMTPEPSDKICDIFYRADASDTATKGLGLGMSVVKQVIDAHGGKISITSSPDNGTSVTFVLPRHDQPPGRVNNLATKDKTE